MHNASVAVQLSRSLEQLEADIGELSAHIDAARCRLLLDIAEFDRREGWARSGFRSCAHWLGWRIGLDLNTAREQVRVGRALEALPHIRAAFASGQVSYSKVRTISRVANDQNELELLELARHGTAAHLVRLCRLFRGCSATEEREQAQRQHQQRYLRTWTDADGMLCIQGRLPAELGAMLNEALQAALRALGHPPQVATAQTSADVSAGQAQDRDEHESEHQHEREDEHEDEDEHEGEADAGAEEAVMEDREAERELRESVRGTFVAFGPTPRVRPLVELAPEASEQRAADALSLVAQWALAARAGATDPQHEHEQGGREGRYEVVLHVDAEVLAADAPVGHCELQSGPRLSAETLRRLCCASPTVTLRHGSDGALLGPGRRTRRISAPLWRALRSRDRTCAWPGCTAQHALVVHHVEHWAHGGETTLHNLACLCKAHHWAVHEGGFRIQGRAPDGLAFFDPQGRELPASPAPVHGDRFELIGRHRDLGLAIGPDTGLTRWQGEPMDYDWALASLTRKRSG